MRVLIPTMTLALAVSTSAFAAELADLDTNEDGVLSVEEFVVGHAETDPAVFAAIDVNEDGLIDPDEYKTATMEGGALYES